MLSRCEKNSTTHLPLLEALLGDLHVPWVLLWRDSRWTNWAGLQGWGMGSSKAMELVGSQVVVCEHQEKTPFLLVECRYCYVCCSASVIFILFSKTFLLRGAILKGNGHKVKFKRMSSAADKPNKPSNLVQISSSHFGLFRPPKNYTCLVKGLLSVFLWPPATSGLTFQPTLWSPGDFRCWA